MGVLGFESAKGGGDLAHAVPFMPGGGTLAAETSGATACIH